MDEHIFFRSVWKRNLMDWTQTCPRAVSQLYVCLQHWKVYVEMKEVFILVPALLGLKGNLEMTLASRLSTQVRLHLSNMYFISGSASVVYLDCCYIYIFIIVTLWFCIDLFWICISSVAFTVVKSEKNNFIKFFSFMIFYLAYVQLNI